MLTFVGIVFCICQNRIHQFYFRDLHGLEMHHKNIIEAFRKEYNTDPEITVRAPGRINLIGEHTDYNDGFVLPAAVNKSIYFCLSSREDDLVNLYSADLNETCSLDIHHFEKTETSWANFLIGVAAELKSDGALIDHGFNLAFGGDVPLGAGMSSSAAIESGMGTALNELFDLNKTKLELALIAQRAEHHFAGVRCGIMDMYASILGKEKQLIRLDCRDLTHKYLPFDFENIDIVLFNSGVKHNLAETQYNVRREQCEAGVKILNSRYGQISSLRDADMKQLMEAREEMTDIVFDRCHFVISETERMMRATAALENHDLKEFGELMLETHRGLRDEYEVSCAELDFLVDLVKDETGVYGARMMGGGFGGCTINLIKSSEKQRIIDLVTAAYQRQFGIIPEHYEVEITDGCELITVLQEEKL